MPNAYFEKTLTLLHEVGRTARAYVQGLLMLTLLDTLTLAAGLWLMNFPAGIAGLMLVLPVLGVIRVVGETVGTC